MLCREMSRQTHALATNLIRHKVPRSKIMTVTCHKSLDTLLAYAHEVHRDEDPAEAYVDYGNGTWGVQS
jgi:hypothetical protein